MKGETQQIIKKLIVRKITKWRISKALGVHWNTVRNWELGKFEAKDFHLEKLREIK